MTEDQIVAWARAYHERTGAWPNENSGPIPDSRGEDWGNVNQALRDGDRGLPGGDTLARLLARRLSIRNRASMPRLTLRQILAWADEHHARTGQWPQHLSGERFTGLRANPGGRSTMPCVRDTVACKAVPPWPSCSPGVAACGTSPACPA